MKLIEFKAKREGEEMSGAWITFGECVDLKTSSLFYVSVCLPWVITKLNQPHRVIWHLRYHELVAWIGYRVNIHIKTSKLSMPKISACCYPVVLKRYSWITEEKYLNGK